MHFREEQKKSELQDTHLRWEKNTNSTTSAGPAARENEALQAMQKESSRVSFGAGAVKFVMGKVGLTQKWGQASDQLDRSNSFVLSPAGPYAAPG